MVSITVLVIERTNRQGALGFQKSLLPALSIRPLRRRFMTLNETLKKELPEPNGQSAKARRAWHRHSADSLPGRVRKPPSTNSLLQGRGFAGRNLPAGEGMDTFHQQLKNQYGQTE